MKKLMTLALIVAFFVTSVNAQQIKSVVVQKRHNQNVLCFMVSSETNVVDYRIEASSDNVRFAIVGKVKSTGNSVLAKAYQYELPGDQLYYRVAAVGMNGAISYSETVASPDPNYPQSRAITQDEQSVATGR